MNDGLTLNTLVSLGILLLSGCLGGCLAHQLKFPRISGYIIAGILLSPSVTGILPRTVVTDQSLTITEMALAVIAYSIGGSLELSRIKRMGRSITWILVGETGAAFVVVAVLLAVMGPWILKSQLPGATFVEVYLPMALIIGAVSAATAPAAVLAIVREYNARGPLVTTILSVVALDDAVAIILFSLSSGTAKVFAGAGPASIWGMALKPLAIIAGSALMGAVFGVLLSALGRWMRKSGSFLVLVLGVVLLCAGIARQMELSPLLANMVLGLHVVNRSKRGDSLLQSVEGIEEAVFALFFTVAGAHFDPMVMKTAGMISVIIVAGRFSGKLAGARAGARFSHAPAVVEKYIGYSLLPKAGVTLGLILMAKSILSPEVAEVMINAVLGSVIINELIAPPLVKSVLIRSGEASTGTA
ncbi:MAG: cation:proton antiporter [Oceanipulchritudo sp.]